MLIHWLGYEIETTISFLFIAIAVIFVAILGIYHIIAMFFKIPSDIGNHLSEQKNEKGYKLLTQGFTAIAEGDTKKAKKLADKSGKLLKDSSMNLLLSAQVAQLEGDKEKITKLFSEMAESKEMATIGLRGLLMEAKKEQNADKALEYAEKIKKRTPKQEWIYPVLIELYAYTKNWQKTLDTIKHAAKHGFISKQNAMKKNAIVYYEMAQDAKQDADKLAFLKKSHNIYAGIIPASIEYAKLAGKEKILHKAWATNPHPDIGNAYLDFIKDLKEEQQTKKLRAFFENNPEHYETYLFAAELAIKEQNWDEAKRQLGRASGLYTSKKIYKLLAEISEKEDGNLEKVQEYWREAAIAPEDASWMCNECGNKHEEWAGVCGFCHSFGTVEWEMATRNMDANVLLEAYETETESDAN